MKSIILCIGVFFFAQYAFSQGGTTCETAAIVGTGTHTADNSAGDQWYTYTNSSSEEEVLSFIGGATSYVTLYSDCDTYFADGFYHLDHLIGPGETILVHWQNMGQWNFESRTPGSGDKCELAKVAVIGTTIPAYYSNWQWFMYTNHEAVEKVVETSIDELNPIYVYDACHNPIPLDWAIEKLSYITAPGQSLYFLCGYTEEFNLAIRDIEPGDKCSDPVVGQEGLNFNANLGLDLWYSYTNTSTVPQGITVATNESNFIRVYESCGTSPMETTEYNFQHILSAGESVYFQMEKAEVYSIDIGNALQGDVCANPIPAQYGVNYPSKIQEEQWFGYTNTSTQIEYLKVDYDRYMVEPIPNTFDVLTTCDQPISNIGRAYSGVIEVFPGKSFLLHYFNLTNWTMSAHTPGEAEYCSTAKEVLMGLNEADNTNGNQWYTYTNATAVTQSIEITSCNATSEDTYASIHSACQGSSIEYSDDVCDSQSELYHDVLPGETIYIEWSNQYTSGIYNWNFLVQGITSNQNAAQGRIFKVFPTSSEGEYHFSESVQSVEVYNSMGVLVMNDHMVSSVNISTFSQGMYIFKINSRDAIKMFRVLKE